jgi:hypothetical protein
MWIVQQTVSRPGEPHLWVDHTSYDDTLSSEFVIDWLFYYADKYPLFQWRIVRKDH